MTDKQPSKAALEWTESFISYGSMDGDRRFILALFRDEVDRVARMALATLKHDAPSDYMPLWQSDSVLAALDSLFLPKPELTPVEQLCSKIGKGREHLQDVLDKLGLALVRKP